MVGRETRTVQVRGLREIMGFIALGGGRWGAGIRRRRDGVFEFEDAAVSAALFAVGHVGSNYIGQR